MAVIEELIALLGFRTDPASKAAVQGFQQDAQLTKQQLKDIEVASKQASAQIIQNLRQQQAAFAQAEQRAHAFGQRIGNGFANIGRGVMRLTTGVLATTLGVNLSLAGMAAAVKSTTEEYDKLLKVAERIFTKDKLRQGFRDIQELGYVAEQSGGSVEGFASELEMLTQRLGEARRGSGRATAALQRFQIFPTKTSGEIKTGVEMFHELAAAFPRMEKAEQLDLASKLGLSRSTITALQLGTKGIKEFIDEARAFGLIVDLEAAQAADKFNDALSLLWRTAKGVKDRLMFDLLPSMQEYVEIAKKWYLANQEIIRSRMLQWATNVGGLFKSWVWYIKIAYRVIGEFSDWLEKKTGIGKPVQKGMFAGLALSLLAATGPLGLLIAGFTAFLLVIDDIRAYTEGRGSVIGRIVKWFEGLDENHPIKKFGKLFETLLTSISGFGTTLKGIFKELEEGWNKLLAAFGLEGVFKGGFQRELKDLEGIITGVTWAINLIDRAIQGFVADCERLIELMKAAWTWIKDKLSPTPEGVVPVEDPWGAAPTGAEAGARPNVAPWVSGWNAIPYAGPMFDTSRGAVVPGAALPGDVEPAPGTGSTLQSLKDAGNAITEGAKNFWNWLQPSKSRGDMYTPTPGALSTDISGSRRIRAGTPAADAEPVVEAIEDQTVEQEGYFTKVTDKIQELIRAIAGEAGDKDEEGRSPGDPGYSGPASTGSYTDPGRGSAKPTGPLGDRIAVAKAAMETELRAQGVPEANIQEAANWMAGQGIAESWLNPGTVHDAGTGYGIYGARDPGGRGKQRRTEMLKWLAEKGYARDSLEGQSRYMIHEAMTDPTYKAARAALMQANPSLRKWGMGVLTQTFEIPKNRFQDRSEHAATAAAVAAGAAQSSAGLGVNGPSGVSPTGGAVTSPMGWRAWQGRFHQGTDTRGGVGTPVKARFGGQASVINGYGDIMVRNDDGSTSKYLHVAPGVQAGRVEAGQQIGVIGPSGPGTRDRRSTGPHLHEELRDKYGRLVDTAKLDRAARSGTGANTPWVTPPGRQAPWEDATAVNNFGAWQSQSAGMPPWARGGSNAIINAPITINQNVTGQASAREAAGAVSGALGSTLDKRDDLGSVEPQPDSQWKGAAGNIDSQYQGVEGGSGMGEGAGGGA